MFPYRKILPNGHCSDTSSPRLASFLFMRKQRFCFVKKGNLLIHVLLYRIHNQLFEFLTEFRIIA